MLDRHRQPGDQAQESDEQLVSRMHGGDDQAFAELYERYFDRIYAFVLRRVTHHETAEDLVSTVFMKAFAGRGRFTWKVSFSAWLYRIATNAVTDHYRTRKPADQLDETVDVPESRPGPASDVDQGILGRELEQVLEALDERDRLALTMKFYGQCDNGEIAQALGCTPNHAGVIVYRALKKCEDLASERLKAMASL